MLKVKEVLEKYPSGNSNGDGRMIKMVIKKACVVNGFQNWEDTPIQVLNKDIFKDKLVKDGVNPNTVKTYLCYFDKFMGLAKSPGIVVGHTAVIANPLLKSSWETIEEAGNKVIVIQKLAGYSIARGKSSQELNQDFLEKFCTDCQVSRSQLAKHWNDLYQRKFVQFKYAYTLPKKCYHLMKFEELGANSLAFQTEWEKICDELGPGVSGKRSARCSGAGDVTMGNRKNTIQYLLWWYLNVKLNSQQRKRLIKAGGLTIKKLLQVKSPYHTNVEKFIRYGNKGGIAPITQDAFIGDISTILRNYYQDPVKDLSRMRSQLKTQFDVYEMPQRYQKKIDEVELKDIYNMLQRLKSQRENAKDEFEKAKLCRDELLIRLLVCHVLRRLTIAKLRKDGKKPNFEYIDDENGGRWKLVLYPDDHKTSKSSKRFNLLDLVKDAHENWVNRYRAILLKGKSCDNYLVRDDGKPFNAGNITDHTKRITTKMLGIAINPHLFRDIMASKLIALDERYLIAVSKMLLHKSIDFTARKYVRYTDEKASSKINNALNSIR